MGGSTAKGLKFVRNELWKNLRMLTNALSRLVCTSVMWHDLTTSAAYLSPHPLKIEQNHSRLS
eukprot:scaffold222712_cov27-Tisochrysis_lutea.AAC.2